MRFWLATSVIAGLGQFFIPQVGGQGTNSVLNSGWQREIGLWNFGMDMSSEQMEKVHHSSTGLPIGGTWFQPRTRTFSRKANRRSRCRRRLQLDRRLIRSDRPIGVAV